MKYHRIGNSGLKLTEVTFGSALTIGTEIMDIRQAEQLIDMAWKLGIRSFDLSNNYGMGNAERIVGDILQNYPREEFVIATKGSWPVGDTPYHKGLSRKHILWAFDESMQRIGMQYIDIYYAHRYDPETSMEEIVRTFNYLIQTGRVRYWATSEWPQEALQECHEVCNRLGLEKPILEQCIYSFAVRKTETNGVKDFCEKNNIGMLGFSPLCQGLLTGKYRNGIPKGSRVDKSKALNYDKTLNFYEQSKDKIDGFLDVFEKFKILPSHAAIQWGIQKNIYPVLGASSPDQLMETVSGLNIDIPKEMWEELEQL
mgnify:FL=1